MAQVRPYHGRKLVSRRDRSRPACPTLRSRGLGSTRSTTGSGRRRMDSIRVTTADLVTAALYAALREGTVTCPLVLQRCRMKWRLYSARFQMSYSCRVGTAHRRVPQRPKTVGSAHPTKAHSPRAKYSQRIVLPRRSGRSRRLARSPRRRRLRCGSKHALTHAPLPAFDQKTAMPSTRLRRVPGRTRSCRQA